MWNIKYSTPYELCEPKYINLWYDVAMDELSSIIGDYRSFLKGVLGEVVAEGFDVADFIQLDHMGYRTPSRDVYDVKKEQLSNIARLLGEVQINGRAIVVFRFIEPIYHENWRIDAIEILAPKPDIETKEGLEHIEFVLFDGKEDFLKKYSDKQFNLSAVDRGLNPEIGFKLPHYGVKFHLLNLPTVVYLEQKTGLTDIHDAK
jgi:predicted metalloenzyme YecM